MADAAAAAAAALAAQAAAENALQGVQAAVQNAGQIVQDGAIDMARVNNLLEQLQGFQANAQQQQAQQAQAALNARLAAINNFDPRNQKDIDRGMPRYHPAVQTWASYRRMLDSFLGTPVCAGVPPFILKSSIRLYGIPPEIPLNASFFPQREDAETVEAFLNRIAVHLEGELYTRDFVSQFEERRQGNYENVRTYYHVKKELFDSAYPPDRRDPVVFFDAVLTGLVNDEVRDLVRTKMTFAKADGQDMTEAQVEDLIYRCTRDVRSKGKLGYRTEAQVLGTAMPTPKMFPTEDLRPQAADRHGQRGVHGIVGRRADYSYVAAATEPVAECHALAGRPTPNRSFPTNHRPGAMQATVNTRNFRPDPHRAEANDLCYWCLSKGHYKINCPKKAAGVPKAVNQLGQDYEAVDHQAYADPHVDFQQEVHAAYPGPARGYRPYRPSSSSRGGPKKPFQQRKPFRKPQFPKKVRFSVNQTGESVSLTEQFVVNDQGDVVVPPELLASLEGLHVSSYDDGEPEQPGADEPQDEAADQAAYYAPSNVYSLTEPYIVPEASSFLGL